MSVLNLFNLEGEVAVVTGAGKGIGRGIALSLAEAGADIALASRSEDQLNAVANEIKGIGKRALVIPTDVTDTESMENLGRKTVDAVSYTHLTLPTIYSV